MANNFFKLEEETIENENYRKVVLTTKHQQLVLMSLLVKEEIGYERHNNDQFIKLEQGELVIVINSVPRKLIAGDSATVPANSLHNVVNVGDKIIQFKLS